MLMKSGNFYLGSRTRDSANRGLALNHSATVACIRSNTRHRGGAVKSQASVRRIPGSTPEIKIYRFHQISRFFVLAQERKEKGRKSAVFEFAKVGARVFAR